MLTGDVISEGSIEGESVFTLSHADVGRSCFLVDCWTMSLPYVLCCVELSEHRGWLYTEVTRAPRVEDTVSLLPNIRSKLLLAYSILVTKSSIFQQERNTSGHEY